MSHFYLTLPSNSSIEYFPNNTLTHFITKLHNDVSLNGDWEVALVDIIYPRNWHNVSEQYIDISYDPAKKTLPLTNLRESESLYGAFRVPIPSAYYSSMAELTTAINDSISDTFKHPIPSWSSEGVNGYLASSLWPSFYYDAQDRKVKLSMVDGIYVDIPERLAGLLGMNPTTEADAIRHFSSLSTVESYKPCDIEGGLHALYVYCDVMESIPVGDTMAPLLRIIEVAGSRNKETQTMTHIQYDQPRYFPVQKKTFDSIEIDIRDDTGESIPFDSGKLIVTLHFRRAKDTYFVG